MFIRLLTFTNSIIFFLICREDAAFVRGVTILVGLWYLTFFSYFVMLESGSSHIDTSNWEGKSCSHCQAAASANPAVKNP